MSNNFVLIVATSGRMLAQQARRSGFKPLVIDLFADLDTCEIAEDVRQVKSLASSDLAQAITDFRTIYQVNDVVYGSGFEKNIQSLWFLHEKLNLLGNSPDVFANIQDKARLFNVLLENNIAFPEVCFSRPSSGKWLIKPVQSEGGIGIRHDKGNKYLDDCCYWQKLLEGESLSVLFIADGENAHILGFNKQWTISHTKNQAFVFSGIHNLAELSIDNKEIIFNWLAKLVSHFYLRGLNSVDFILYQEQCYFLEINPRPSASMELYDTDLLAAHIESASDLKAETHFVQEIHKGYQIIYAARDILIPEEIIWPEWTQDRPKDGLTIHKEQPVCSIIANGESSEQVLSKLKTRQQIIENSLTEGKSYHAIHSECQ